MADFSPFPQSPLHTGWIATDGGACELEVRFENEGWTAQGTLGSDRAQFVMRLSATLIVQQFMLFRDMDEPDLWLGRDRAGRWGEVNGAHRPDLDGCTDIELRMNPFPTSMTMKRLPLHESHAASLVIASIDVETLEVAPRQRTFTRLSGRRWRYVSRYTESEVEVELDEFGLVIDEPGAFSRRAPDAPSS
ncbi:MAG: putative glycolipid-binding domain-containing protein [Actinomycetota bacterium]